ncbi:MAG: hypothetical protein ACJ75T_02900 [Solirubrobacterales bacterium]
MRAGRPATSKLLAAALAICLVVPAGTQAASGQLTPEAGSSWQPRRAFAIDWDPIAPPNPTGAIYKLRDSAGALVAEMSRSLDRMRDDIEVPPVPDAYTLEAWLANANGETGPHSVATLRFDNAAPGAPIVDPPSGWVLGADAAVVEIGAPADPLPLSSIAGYAVSVDADAGSSPCGQAGRCLPSEIDLPGSKGGALSLGTVPEGIHTVRAAAVSGSGVPSAVMAATVRVDASAPLVSLDGTPAGWSSGPLRVTARATDGLSGMAASGLLGPFTAIAVDGGAPGRTLGDAVSAWIGGSGLHLVEYFARDAAGNLSSAGLSAVRIDEDPPLVAFSAAQDPAEPERIEAAVSDPLSGPSPDRGSIGIRPAGTRARYEQLPTRNAGDRLVAHWDSDSYPPGKYELIATGFDVTGNSAAGTDRAHGARMVLVNPLKAQVELTAGLSGKLLTGGLRRFGGGPLASRDVVVTESFAAGSEPRQRTTVVGTDRQGAFALRLRPGPSRDIVARFAGTPVLSRAASRSSHFDAATKIRLRTSSSSARVGGGPVVFSGKIAHRGIVAGAAAGLPVELQFRFGRSPWSEFRTVEANARGRFRYRYRFSDDDSRGVRFQFRAYVKGREGWPYGPGTSRPVSVTGR